MRACVQCWRDYEYLMQIEQNLENIGEGLLHACISSSYRILVMQQQLK